jgi:DNA-binding IclR family transcriptional regulator
MNIKNSQNRSFDDSKNKDDRSSLVKGLALLKVVAFCGSDGITLSSAARLASVHTATARRLLQSMVESGFLSHDPYSRLYHLGVMPYELVARAGDDVASIQLRHRMRKSLRQMQEDIGGIVCLSVPSLGDALCIDVIAGDTEIQVNTLEIGSRRPLGVGGASLALLASIEESEREVIIAREAQRYLKYGNLNESIVREAAARLKLDGYVVNEAHIIPGISAIAIPLIDGGRVVAALSVTNTTSRLAHTHRSSIASKLRDVAIRGGFNVWNEDFICTP